MSDTADDTEAQARRLLEKSRTYPLRERMRRFVSDHGTSTDFKAIREEIATGEELSETVIEGRDERL